MRNIMNHSRKIPLNHQNVTGYISSEKSKYSAAESTLEADFITLLDFNRNVKSFMMQPVTIQYNQNDLRNTYTPDVKVIYQNGETIYYEVKYRKDLFKNWKELKVKFKSAIRFAKTDGAKFKIITEQEIRNDYLKNIQFLKTYLYSNRLNAELCFQIQDIIKELNSTTPADLLNILYKHKWNKPEGLFAIWLTIAAGEHGDSNVKADLFKPLSMNTEIWWDYEN